MPAPASVTVWIQQIRTGDPHAAQKLWEGYFRRLVGLARKKLGTVPRRSADEEDVALSAFDSFCRGAAQGRFPQLDDRDDLWQLLLVITERKAIDLVQHEGRQKRDWRRLKAGAGDASSAAASPLAGVAGKEPDPAFAAQVAEECERLLAKLPNDKHRAIALRKMEGYTNEEIEKELGCSLPTVERRLRIIRKTWDESSHT